jgi:hypothetical protein
MTSVENITMSIKTNLFQLVIVTKVVFFISKVGDYLTNFFD